MLTLLSSFTLSLLPQGLPEPPANPQMRFVDFSQDLERPGVTAMVARVGRIREGKRERIREGARLGGNTAQVSVSGTQYYKVPVRARLEGGTVLAGADPGERVEIETDVQVARLPDGTEHRQTMTGNGSAFADDMLALWVFERPRRGRRPALLHVIPFHEKADRGPKPEAAFTDNMRDFCAVNVRVRDLRLGLAETEKIDGDEAVEKALKRLRELAEAKPEMRNPDHDALLTRHAAPLERRVRDRIAKLEGGG